MANNVNAASNSVSTYKINTISGLNSGLDTEAIVNAMVSNIQSKVDANKQDTQVYQWKQSAYRGITDKIENFYDKYFKYSSSSDSVMNEAFFTDYYCSSSSDAVSATGNTQFMDYTKIKSATLATKSSVTSGASVSHSNINATLDSLGIEPDGNGKYSMSINGQSFEFDGSATLRDVISKVNGNDNTKVDMLYSSVTGKFTLASVNTGSANTIDVSGNLADAVFGADRQLVAGTDFTAQMSFDGTDNYVTVTQSSNAFTLDGVNYNFKANINEEVTFTSGANIDAVADRVKEFINDYNDIMASINEQVYAKKYGEDIGSGKVYKPLTDAQKKEMTEKEIEEWNKKAQTGLLKNDSTLLDIATRFRQAMSSLVEGQGLYQYGIDTKKWTDRGVLTVDENQLKTKLREDPGAISRLFVGENGLSDKVRNVINYAVRGTGVGSGKGVLVELAGKSSSGDNGNTIAMKIKSLQDRLTTLQAKLDDKKEYWWKKFTYLETYISSMNSQSAFLSSI